MTHLQQPISMNNEYGCLKLNKAGGQEGGNAVRRQRQQPAGLSPLVRFAELLQEVRETREIWHLRLTVKNTLKKVGKTKRRTLSFLKTIKSTCAKRQGLSLCVEKSSDTKEDR